MKPHPSLTQDRIIAAVEENNATLSNKGFCLACGEEADGVEPDACQYECEFCGREQVYGAEELLIMGGF